MAIKVKFKIDYETGAYEPTFKKDELYEVAWIKHQDSVKPFGEIGMGIRRPSGGVVSFWKKKINYEDMSFTAFEIVDTKN